MPHDSPQVLTDITLITSIRYILLPYLVDLLPVDPGLVSLISPPIATAYLRFWDDLDKDTDEEHDDLGVVMVRLLSDSSSRRSENLSLQNKMKMIIISRQIQQMLQIWSSILKDSHYQICKSPSWFLSTIFNRPVSQYERPHTVALASSACVDKTTKIITEFPRKDSFSHLKQAN